MGLREKLDHMFPKGFHPTDEEIIDDLQHKVLGQTDECLIPYIHVHEENEAWDLASMINDMWGWELKEWCFISSFKGKYKKGKRQSRSTHSGYWRRTGKERKIRSEETNKIMGSKKTLVFYMGRVPNGKRTNWVMHEYHLNPKYLAKHCKQDQVSYIGCRLRKKKDKKGANKHGKSESNEADRSISISNSSNFSMERGVAKDDPISMSDNPNNNVGRDQSGDVVFDEAGSHSSCNVVPKTESAEIPGFKEGLGVESFPHDFNEFFGNLEMEHGGELNGDDDEEWRRPLNWDDPISVLDNPDTVATDKSSVAVIPGNKEGLGVEMEHDGGLNGDDDEEWRRLINWEEVNKMIMDPCTYPHQ